MSGSLANPNRAAWMVAIVAGAFAACWQEFQVQTIHAGNVSALYRTASTTVLPPELASTTLRSAVPYDGQWYRLVARDPWSGRGWAAYVDDFGLRYRRILVPGLAWILALGNDSAIDRTFQWLLIAFLACGAYWSALYLNDRGHSPLWGFLFCLLPGTVIGLQWLTVDVAFYSLTIGSLLAWQRGSLLLCWVAAAAAALSRDLGFIACASVACAALVRKQAASAILLASSAIPAVSWYASLKLTPVPAGVTSGVLPHWVFHWPVWGAVEAVFLRSVLPFHPDFPPLPAVERVAIAAHLLAFAIVFFCIPRHHWADPAVWVTLFLTLVFIAASSRGYWNDPLSYPRAFSLWLAAIAMLGVEKGVRLAAVPLAVATLRGLLHLLPPAAA